MRLFSVFERVLADAGLKSKIELTCTKPDGTECTPDFIIEEEEWKTIIEHKASLSEREMNAGNVLDDIYDKYSPLISNSNGGQIAGFFPKEDEETVQLAIHLIADDLILSSFRMIHDQTTLKISTLKGQYRSRALAEIMETEFGYDFTEFARYRLIRMKPPVPLVADIVWNYVLLPLYGESGEFGDEVLIDYQRILDETKTQVRGHGADSESQLRGVVNRALKFLNRMGWVEYRGEDEAVNVYPRKGKGMGQIRRLFCNKWFQFKTREDGDDETEEYQNDGYQQKSLEDY